MPALKNPFAASGEEIDARLKELREEFTKPDGGFSEGRRSGSRIPLGGPRHQLAVAVAPRVDVGDDDRRQATGLAQAGAVLLDRALLLQILQQALELDLVGALDAEGLGDLALAHLLRRLFDEGEHGLAGGQGAVRRFRVISFGQQVDPRRDVTAPGG